MPTIPKKKKDKRVRNKANEDVNRWERLEIEPADLLKHPKITHIIVKSLGSVDSAIEYLRGSDAKDAMELIRLWDLGSPADHIVIPFEGYCIAAKSSPTKMIGILMETVTKQSSIATEMLVAASHPEIVEITIKNAKELKGFADREIIHKNRGFVAIPKTQQFNNYGQITTDNRKQVANISVGQLDEDNDKISESVDKFNAQRVLKAGSMPEVEVIDVMAEE